MHPPAFMRKDMAPRKRGHNLVLWWGREISKHTWCLGCGMRSIRSTLMHYQLLVMLANGARALTDPRRQQQPSEVNLPPGPCGCSHTQPQAMPRTLLLSYPQPLPATRMTPVPWGQCHSHHCKHLLCWEFSSPPGEPPPAAFLGHLLLHQSVNSAL